MMSENNHDENFEILPSPKKSKPKGYRQKFNNFVKESAKNFRENTTKAEKVLFIAVAMLGLSARVGYDIHANHLNEARTHLSQAEETLNQKKNGYVSEETTRAISKETADTAKIREIWLYPQKIEQETKALEALVKQAHAESQGVKSLIAQAQRLLANENISPTDQRLLENYQKQANSYQTFSGYKSKFEEETLLVEAHNSRTEALNLAEKSLKDKDLPKENRAELDKLVKSIKNAKKANEIKDLANELTGKVNISTLRIQEVKEARALKNAKDKAKGNISAAEKLQSSVYTEQTDKEELQKLVTAVNQATTAKTVENANADLSAYLIGAKQRENTAAEKAHKEKAAQEAQAKRQAEEKAKQEAARKTQNEENSANSAPITSGGWTTAAPGMVYYRDNSSRYYRMVKNPGNYTYMTVGEAEARGATPGHSNGSAKN